MAADRVITRFAPSPTGYLHVGGARTALFNWLLARHTGGQFLLRIEDTDLARSTEASANQLLEDLKWLGLQWDNPQLVYQSKRLQVYDKIIADLISRGLAYEAFETREELEALSKQAEKEKRTYLYKRPPADVEGRCRAQGRPSVVRFATPIKEYRFRDVILAKDIVLAANQIQDFVIRKTDGMPTFHFAVVVDDAEMGITHVLRGQEHMLNTINHIALQEALGYPRPTYGHLPVILAPESGEKLSKRDRDRRIRQRANEWIKNKKITAADLAAKSGLTEARIHEWLAEPTKQLDLSEQPRIMQSVGLKESDLPEIMIHDFRKNGYLPEVLNNFLALLGWNPGGDRERMSMAELTELFTLENVGRSNAKFNREKLLAFNTEAIAAAPIEHLVRAMRDFLAANPDSPLNRGTDEHLAQLIRMAPGARTLRELHDKSRFLFQSDDEIEYAPDAVEKILRKNDGEGVKVLRDLRPLLAAVTHWNHTTLEAAVTKYGEQKQLGLNKLAQPLRVALSGGTISPPIFQSLEFLGKSPTLARVDRCFAKFG
ncbi:MAG TPA: glutamate--tRNA ligase [Tepidisphaeraceae bacterium]|jgi:glutamyl-tRNA synthetase